MKCTSQTRHNPITNRPCLSGGGYKSKEIHLNQDTTSDTRACEAMP